MTFDTLTTGNTETSLAGLGFELSSCKGEKKSQSADTWTGTIINTPIGNNPLFNFEQQITIQSGRISASGLPNTFSGGVIKFVGVRVLAPSEVGSRGPGFTYTFQGGRYYLDNIQYKQGYANATGSCSPAEIILFTRAPFGGAWTNISPGQQISDIINYAITTQFNQTGQYFAQLGTIDVGLNQSIFPSLICKPMTCSAAIDKCLEMFPRTNEVWDYTTAPPTVSFTMTGGMAPVVLPICDGVNHKSLNITPRQDLLARAVVITYRITSQENGQPIVSYAIDQWGPVAEAAYQNAGGDGNRAAGNAAAQAKSAQQVYINAYNAAFTGSNFVTADAAGIIAVNNAVKLGACDPREGIRVPSEIVDISGAKVTTATAYLDCEPVLACAADGSQQQQQFVRQWWAEHRGGGVSELGTTKIRFQTQTAATANPIPTTIPNAILSSGNLTGIGIINPGSGYSSGDALGLVGGVLSPNSANPNNSLAQIQVQDVDVTGSITGSKGAILSAVITNGGYYTEGNNPPSPNRPSNVAPTSGAGFGAVLACSFLTLQQLLANYPNRIVRGTHHSWMEVNGVYVASIKVRIKAAMQYAEYDVFAQYPNDGITPGNVTSDTARNGNLTNYDNAKEHHCDLELTNGVTGAYSTINSTTPGEAYIIGVNPVAINGVGYNGIARTLWLLLNQPQYQGNWVKVETDFNNGVTLNNVANLSGGNPLWLTMNAQITGLSEDYATHTTSVQIGPSKHLNATQMSSLLNMWRLRQPWFNPALRTDNTQDAQGSDIALPVTSGNANTTKGSENPAMAQFVTYNN